MLKSFFCPDGPRSRLAPTPSGFLHMGNALNFILTWLLVRGKKGRLHLRIDDMDGIRVRADVVEDIFSSLDWLGLDWDTGPAGPEEFYARFSLMTRMDFYEESVRALLEKKAAYVCECSRKSLVTAGMGRVYPGRCRQRGVRPEAGRTSVRLEVPAGTRIRVTGREFRLDEDFGDFVIWRKEGLAAYHLASVLEDEAGGMNLIVRGEDLMPSTAAQIFLAEVLGLRHFQEASFIHHGLVTGGTGEKLSKSRGAHALCDMRGNGFPVAGVYGFVASFLGLNPGGTAFPESLKDLQAMFGEHMENLRNAEAFEGMVSSSDGREERL